MSNQPRQGSFLEASVPPLAAKAKEALRLGDFKQAIELFKRLVKQDARPEWRDALAEAYAGRARILAAKGLFEEAETALSKAATPDGTVPDPLLHVQCLVKRGQVHKAAELAVKYIGNDKVPAAAAPKLAELAAALWLAAPVPLAPLEAGVVGAEFVRRFDAKGAGDGAVDGQRLAMGIVQRRKQRLDALVDGFAGIGQAQVARRAFDQPQAEIAFSKPYP